MDELLTSLPYRGCQLKWDPHEPWGVPADEMVREFRPSTFTSGYIKSELPHPVACSGWLPNACLSCWRALRSPLATPSVELLVRQPGSRVWSRCLG